MPTVPQKYGIENLFQDQMINQENMDRYFSD